MDEGTLDELGNDFITNKLEEAEKRTGHQKDEVDFYEDVKKKTRLWPAKARSTKSKTTTMFSEPLDLDEGESSTFLRFNKLESELAAERLLKEAALKDISTLVEKEASATMPSSREAYPEFECPIKMELMNEPAIAADGHSYERSAITAWLENNNTSPNTNDELEHKMVTPNHALRIMIKDWKARQQNNKRRKI